MTEPPSSIDREGFSVHAGAFSRAEMIAVVQALDVADLLRSRAGARHVLGVPAVRALAMDPRMLTVACDYLGHPVITYRATLFEKSPAASWLVLHIEYASSRDLGDGVTLAPG